MRPSELTITSLANGREKAAMNKAEARIIISGLVHDGMNIRTMTSTAKIEVRKAITQVVKLVK